MSPTHDVEVGRRRARRAAGHRDRAVGVAEAGLAGRLVGDRRQQPAPVAPPPALDQAAAGRAVIAR